MEKERPPTKPLDLCKTLEGTKGHAPCIACQGSPGNGKEERIWTAIGCLPTSTNAIVATLISFGLGIGGLLFFIQIIIGAGEIIFGSGDAGKIKRAKDRITNSIIAILFIIFGVAILQIIGVNILKIPGFFGN